jgi:hypothetical protein
MAFWGRLIDALVVLFALFFIFLGVGFVYYGLTGSALTGTDVAIEGGRGWGKVAVGLVFFLAAAPMLYYVFHPSAKGLPPPERKTKPPAT